MATKGESHRVLGSADRPLVKLSFPGHRSGLVAIHTPPQSFRPAGRVVLVFSAGSVYGSLPLDSRAPVAGPMLRPSPAAVAVVVAAAPVVVAAPVFDPVAAPIPDPVADPVAAPVAGCRCFFSVGAVDLRYPWLTGNALSPWHLIRVSRPIGSLPRHTPGRIRFLVPGCRIRARRAYLPHRTRPRLRSPLASKYLHAYAPQDIWQTRGFGVASPLTPGDTLCLRSSAWIRILLTLPGCPCLVSLLGLSSRAGYLSLYRITPGLNGQ